MRERAKSAVRRLRQMQRVIGDAVQNLWIVRWGLGLSWQIHMRRNREICSIEIDFCNGFFAQLNWCLLILKYCDLHELVPDICLSGQYRDPQRGRNWLDYYFDIPRLMTAEEIARRVRYTKKVGEIRGLGLPIPRRMTLEESVRISHKYLHPKPHITALVDGTWKKFAANGPVVGIHFRGTDKVEEAPRVSWEHCLNILNSYLQIDQNIKAVFVASDEQKFVDFVMRSVKGLPVYSHEDHYRAQRSDDMPIHRVEGGQYEKGEDALVNALLLSRCSTLIRTTSFLSAFASIFNPKLKVILLNKPYGRYLWYPETEILNSRNTNYCPETPVVGNIRLAPPHRPVACAWC